MIEITDINHVSIVSRDMQASKHFYCDILGMVEVPRLHTFRLGGKWFRKGNAEIHLIALEDAAQQPGDLPSHPDGRLDGAQTRHIGFAVADMDEVLRVLRAHNIPVVVGPRPRGDGAIQTYCFDPDGHLVELHTLPS